MVLRMHQHRYAAAQNPTPPAPPVTPPQPPLDPDRPRPVEEPPSPVPVPPSEPPPPPLDDPPQRLAGRNIGRCAKARHEPRPATFRPATPTIISSSDASFQMPAGSPNHKMPIAATSAVPTPDHTA